MFLKRKENQAVVEHENVEGIWSLLNQNSRYSKSNNNYREISLDKTSRYCGVSILC
jgi:hypothetical protein